MNPSAAAEPDALYLSFLQADFVELFSSFAGRGEGGGRPNDSQAETETETETGTGMAQFDVVVTCFLIDAVNHVEDAVRAIRHALRPGGLWLNCGPLQWHENSVLHLALDELLQLVRDAGFEVVEVEQLEPVPYRSDRDAASSTRPLLYRPVLWAARRL